VFSVNNVFWVDSIITIGFIVSNDFNRDLFDITTIPMSWTFSNDEWTVTIDMTIFWTVIISPSVFTHDNTSVEFTSIDGFIFIFITIVHE